MVTHVRVRRRPVRAYEVAVHDFPNLDGADTRRPANVVPEREAVAARSRGVGRAV